MVWRNLLPLWPENCLIRPRTGRRIHSTSKASKTSPMPSHSTVLTISVMMGSRLLAILGD